MPPATTSTTSRCQVRCTASAAKATLRFHRLNLVGDFGGGALYLALGVVAGLLEAQKSGKGQVVDAAMVDGAASLMTAIYGMHGSGFWNNERGDNILDTGAHYYEVYETKDNKYVAIGSIEAKFYAELLEKSGLKGEELPHQQDRTQWPTMKERLKTMFRAKTRDEWCKIMEGSDICFAPVLNMEEAPKHPHNKHRGTFIEEGGVTQPGPAPRFSRTPSKIQRPPAKPGEHTEEALRDWGFAQLGFRDAAQIRRDREVRRDARAGPLSTYFAPSPFDPRCGTIPCCRRSCRFCGRGMPIAESLSSLSSISLPPTCWMSRFGSASMR